MKRNVWLFIPLGIFVGGLGVYVGLKGNHGGIEGRHAVQTPADKMSSVESLFSQSMSDADGVSQKLEQWRGKSLVVNFWATWCSPCVEEMPALVVLQEELTDRKIQVIGIGIDSVSNIKDFSTRLKVSYPLYVGGMVSTELTRKFGNTAAGLPFTVLISSEGKVIKTYLGKLNMNELRQDIARL